jgi:hypothetical protein
MAPEAPAIFLHLRLHLPSTSQLTAELPRFEVCLDLIRRWLPLQRGWHWKPIRASGLQPPRHLKTPRLSAEGSGPLP